MNNSQFKLWFEGFTEQMSGPPDEFQWKRIKEKIDSISDGVNYNFYISPNKSVQPFYPYTTPTPYWIYTTTSQLENKQSFQDTVGSYNCG